MVHLACVSGDMGQVSQFARLTVSGLATSTREPHGRSVFAKADSTASD